MANSRELKKVARGGAIFLFGRLGGTFLQFVGVVIVIRLVEKSEYGLLALGWLLVTITAQIGNFGLSNGLPRFLSKYHAKADKEMAGRFTGTVLLLTSLFSILLAFLLFILSQPIANLLSEPEMGKVLEVFSLAVPPMVTMLTFTAIFRSIESVRPKVIFDDLLSNLIRVLLVVGVLVLHLGFEAIVWVYVISIYAAIFLYTIYAFRTWIRTLPLKVNGIAAKEILLFSLPLLGASIMGSVVEWAAPLGLGYLSSSDQVAAFNAPMRLAKIVVIPLAAIVFLYMPLATKLFEQNKNSSLEELYVSTTKWAFLITMPFAVYCIIDAEFIVTTLFGAQYLDSANVLRVLIVGFSFHTLVGPNGMTLISIGRSQPIFYGQVIAALISIGLCTLLITDYGALGAGLAVSIARIFSNAYISIFLFVKYKIHPFSKQYVKPLVFVFSCGLGLFFIINLLDISHNLVHLFFFILLIILTMAAPFLTRSLTSEDIDLLKSIEKRINKNGTFVDRISSRFQVVK